jgi:hypothetical protein
MLNPFLLILSLLVLCLSNKSKQSISSLTKCLTNMLQSLSVRSIPQTRFNRHHKVRFRVERLSKDRLKIWFSVTIQQIDLHARPLVGGAAPVRGPCYREDVPRLS